MTRNTLSYALRVLDSQRANATNDPTQAAYYNGMRQMLEIITSESYTRDISISANDSTHDITGAEWESICY